MVIITGSSRGIGKAIAEFYLNQGDKVIGVSRSNEIAHPDFTFIPCDLSKRSALEEVELPAWVFEQNNIRLINNAGIIGNIVRAEKLSLADYYDVAIVNVVALQFFTSLLLRKLQPDQLAAVVNISSGAARRAIASWSAYCASKAAVDMYSLTIYEEFKETGRNTKVYSLAPGVVDTDMQATIRRSNTEEFSAHENFVALKQNNELRSPQEVAYLLDELLKKNQQEIITRI
jgi:benzil reductase ((S)-benzoin forming)